MELIKFYKTGEKWVIGDYDGYPAGTCVRHIDPTSGTIRIRPANAPSNSDKSIAKGMATDFCNEGGTAYADLAAFKAATDDFFVKSAGSISSGIEISYATMIENLPYPKDKFIYIANDENKAMSDTVYFYNKSANILMWMAAQKETI